MSIQWRCNDQLLSNLMFLHKYSIRVIKSLKKIVSLCRMLFLILNFLSIFRFNNIFAFTILWSLSTDSLFSKITSVSICFLPEMILVCFIFCFVVRTDPCSLSMFCLFEKSIHNYQLMEEKLLEQQVFSSIAFSYSMTSKWRFFFILFLA